MNSVNTDIEHIETSQQQAMNNRQALDAARAMGIDLLDAQLLLLFALGRSSHERAWLLAHDDHVMLPAEQEQYMALLQRRAIGIPLAYLTGEKEFYGLTFSVDKRVLIPRPDTETLIDLVQELFPSNEGFDGATLKALDLGTGSGILAITLKHLYPAMGITAVDASADALSVAKLNSVDLLPSASTVEFLKGSWFEPVAGQQFDLIVSNPPYIAEGDEHLGALMHEPQEALISGVDGLDDIKFIIKHASTYINQNGYLLIEHGYDQAQAIQALMKKAGYVDVKTKQDLASVDRVTSGKKV